MVDDNMKAWVLHGVGDLCFEAKKKPRLKEGEALIKVKAVGICGSDISRIYTTGTYSFPTIPGHEFAGIVEEVGGGVDQKWKNKRVGVFPLIPCRICSSCEKERYETCEGYGYLGSRQDGAFAEYVSVPIWNLIELPNSVDLEEAAMLEPTAVAVHAMRRIGVDKYGGCVVCGLGTIGMTLLMLLKEAGIRKILAIGNKVLQRTMALKLGVSEENYCDIRERDVKRWLLERTDGKGADCFFECAGTNETISMALELTARGGKVALVGNPASDIALAKAAYWQILRRQLSIVGNWNSFFAHKGNDDWHYVLERIANHRICPAEFITHRFILDSLDKGLSLMWDKREEYGKVMIVN